MLTLFLLFPNDLPPFFSLVIRWNQECIALEYRNKTQEIRTFVNVFYQKTTLKWANYVRFFFLGGVLLAKNTDIWKQKCSFRKLSGIDSPCRSCYWLWRPCMEIWAAAAIPVHTVSSWDDQGLYLLYILSEHMREWEERGGKQLTQSWMFTVEKHFWWTFNPLIYLFSLNLVLDLGDLDLQSIYLLLWYLGDRWRLWFIDGLKGDVC